MRRKGLAVGISILAALFCGQRAAAQRPGCSEAQASRAEDEADDLKSWDALHKSCKLYRGCDDGAIAEGYSDSVAKILANHWDTLLRLDTLSRGDAGFRKFVLRHIDATGDTKDLEKIAESAKRECPEGLGALCAEISNSADEALSEIRRVVH